MDSIAGKIALAGAGMQAGIGDPRVAEELQHEIDEAVEKAKALQPVRVSRG
jgi:chorismate synthase